MYKAKHYVRVNGKTYTRGETLPDGLPAEKIAWYMKKGAIEEVAPGYVAEGTAPEPEEEPEPEQSEEAKTLEEEPAEEADENAEAPEIDVMAGIVGDEQEETHKKTARETTAKKTTERRKTK